MKELRTWCRSVHRLAYMQFRPAQVKDWVRYIEGPATTTRGRGAVRVAGAGRHSPNRDVEAVVVESIRAHRENNKMVHRALHSLGKAVSHGMVVRGDLEGLSREDRCCCRVSATGIRGKSVVRCGLYSRGRRPQKSRRCPWRR